MYSTLSLDIVPKSVAYALLLRGRTRSQSCCCPRPSPGHLGILTSHGMRKSATHGADLSGLPRCAIGRNFVNDFNLKLELLVGWDRLSDPECPASPGPHRHGVHPQAGQPGCDGGAEVAESADSAYSYYLLFAGSNSGTPRLYPFWLH